jgi:hypothetical protein
VPIKTRFFIGTHGLKVAPSPLTVIRLLFADDILLLFNIETNITRKVQDILDLYTIEPWVSRLIEKNH